MPDRPFRRYLSSTARKINENSAKCADSGRAAQRAQRVGKFISLSAPRGRIEVLHQIKVLIQTSSVEIVKPRGRDGDSNWRTPDISVSENQMKPDGDQCSVDGRAWLCAVFDADRVPFIRGCPASIPRPATPPEADS